ncbi:hypothetical protein [Terrisporobacter sp.]
MLQRDITCEEGILTNICSSLDEIVTKTLHIDANFNFYGLKSEGYYTIRNKNKSFKNNRIDLNMRLYFDEENKNEFLYAYILWFSVNPKKMGIGSFIISQIIEILKNFTNIEFIIVHPKDKEVKNFWIKNNFSKDYKLNLEKKININTIRILLYFMEIFLN